MKKVVLALSISCLSMFSFAQKLTYRIGLVTSLPTDTDVSTTRITLGSTVGEVSRTISKKVVATGSVGYTRYQDKEGMKFSQIPVCVGAKYIIDSMFHFGANAGIAFYNKKSMTADFIYSPFVGMQIKRICIDARYVNTVKTEPIKVLALVFSYTL